MTEAEQKLFDAALKQASSDWNGEVPELARAVLLERLPPEYETTLRDLCFRAWDALEAKRELQRKHPLGDRLADRFHEEWKQARGINR